MGRPSGRRLKLKPGQKLPPRRPGPGEVWDRWLADTSVETVRRGILPSEWHLGADGTPVQSQAQRALKAMWETIHGWRLHLRVTWTLDDLAKFVNPTVRGWFRYYGRFYRAALYRVVSHLQRVLVRWAKRKYKSLAHHTHRTEQWLAGIARRDPMRFIHWRLRENTVR